jgi:hypothetical protein
MLKIKEIKLDKPEIKQCKLAEMGVLMSHPFRSYFIGASGSGKTNLLMNLLTRKGYYKDWFDRLFIISPTASSGLDPSYQKVIEDTKYEQDKDLFFFEPNEEVLFNILEVQKEEEKKNKTLVILDDVVSFKSFMNSKTLLQFFIMSRHYNISIFLLSQGWFCCPKTLRLNCSNIIYFKGSDVETETVATEFCPAGYSKKNFKKMIEHATEEAYSFLYVDLNTPMHGKTPRYRKNLDKDLLKMYSIKKNLNI